MTPADATAAQGGRALPSSPPTQSPAGALQAGHSPRQGAVPIAGPREGGEHGRAGARERIGDPRGARAQPRELAQRARRGDREGALRRRLGAAADVAERDAGHIAGSALLEPTTPSERRAASGPTCRPSAADVVVRAPVASSTHVRAVVCAAVRRVTFACQVTLDRVIAVAQRGSTAEQARTSGSVI